MFCGSLTLIAIVFSTLALRWRATNRRVYYHNSRRRTGSGTDDPLRGKLSRLANFEVIGPIWGSENCAVVYCYALYM